MSDESELAIVQARLRGGHDMLPFMAKFYPADMIRLRPLPEDMQKVLEAVPDYRSPSPGEGPVWLQIASGNDAAELVVYRTLASGTLYVVAPDRGT